MSIRFNKICFALAIAFVTLFVLEVQNPETFSSATPGSEMYNIYVGDHPKARKVEWSDNAQGIAHDKNHWYITQERTLWKIPVTADLSNISSKTSGVLTVYLQNIPQLRGYDHFGDFEHYEFKGQGYLLIPIEGKEKPPIIAAFDSSNLGYISHAHLWLNAAPWCAIDSQGIVYTSVSRNSLLFRFGVDWEALRNSRKLILNLLPPIFLQDDYGIPVIIDTPQGGAISPSGNLFYLVAGYYEGSHPSWGIHIFDLRTGRRITRSNNGSGPFNYEFHPGGVKAEEPEGMTIWDLDDGRAPGIAGKLHVLMLDNDPRHDDIYLKHYTDKDAYPVLYEHVNFGGKPLPLRTTGNYSTRDLTRYGFNDIPSSIWMPNGWTVEMYEHMEFKGASLRRTASDPDFHRVGWGDKISSIKVFPPPGK